MIKVLIADDHTMFADGIESILSNESEIQVVEKCYSGTAIFQTIYQQEIDVLLLDIDLPDINGIDVCKRLTASHPNIRVLVLTMHNEESFVTTILKNGAMGYILKNTDKVELVHAIKRVSTGQSYFSEEVTQTIMRGLVSGKSSSTKRARLTPIVSRREKEVLELIVKEHTTQEIADVLNISLKTVESHRRSLLTKLNVRNTAGLVRVTLENNLLEQ